MVYSTLTLQHLQIGFSDSSSNVARLLRNDVQCHAKSTSHKKTSFHCSLGSRLREWRLTAYSRNRICNFMETNAQIQCQCNINSIMMYFKKASLSSHSFCGGKSAKQGIGEWKQACIQSYRNLRLSEPRDMCDRAQPIAPAVKSVPNSFLVFWSHLMVNRGDDGISTSEEKYQLGSNKWTHENK